MKHEIDYSSRERFWLWTLAVAGLVGVNGTFVFGVLHPSQLRQAMTNPIAVAFVVEALVLVAAFAYLLSKWGVTRLSWRWFVLLSLLGSMMFALPVVLLWSPPEEHERSSRLAPPRRTGSASLR